MFQINKTDNALTPLKTHSFTELGFTERQHLQEWIAKRPACLGEDLLILQKEFAEFADTRERLDLLALDKQRQLVIIENKLDDTGRDAAWQVLKYASYCARLKTSDICDIYQDYLSRNGQTTTASEQIAAFLDEDDLAGVTLNRGPSQRIMMVAAQFRKEVTSTVVWLMNFNLQIQCFKATPWARGDDLFLNIEQIIPVKDTEEFTIGLANKARDEVQTSPAEMARRKLLRAFWNDLLPVMATHSDLFANASAGDRSWTAVGSGMHGVGFYFRMTSKYGRVEIYIDRRDKGENEAVFDQLWSQKDALEHAFGEPLVWERQDANRYCRIKHETEADIRDRDTWPDIIAFMTDAMVRMEKAFQEPIQKLNTEMSSRP